MIVLGVDTSANACSTALVRDDILLGERFALSGHTHSATLLSMIDELLKACGLAIQDIDRFAVTAGPGSFTGVRIGVATVKGLAEVGQKPCAGVSTLEAMAALSPDLSGILCCAMDARRSQVYAALFDENGRLSPDEALPIAELERRLLQLNRPVTFFGDGAELCHKTMQQRPDWGLAPEEVRYQRAYGAILAAREEDYGPPALLQATYLRPSQAERVASAIASKEPVGAGASLAQRSA